MYRYVVSCIPQADRGDVTVGRQVEVGCADSPPSPTPLYTADPIYTAYPGLIERRWTLGVLTPTVGVAAPKVQTRKSPPVRAGSCFALGDPTKGER